MRIPRIASRSVFRYRHQAASTIATRATAQIGRVTARTSPSRRSANHDVPTVTKWARIVGSDNQLMILFEPDSAVIQPSPTPATADAAANTATNTANPAPAVFANDASGDA